MVSTPTDLDELDRLRAAATQGEWRAPAKVNIAVHADDCAIYVNRPVGDEAPETRARWDADARWIATAHNAYPAMAAELRELREKVECQRDLVECALAYIQANQRETPDEEEIGDCYTHLYFAAIDMATKQAEPIMQTRGPKP